MEAAQKRWKNKSRNGQTWHYRCCKRNPAQVNNDAWTVDFVIIALLISHDCVCRIRVSTSVIDQQRNSVLDVDQDIDWHFCFVCRDGKCYVSCGVLAGCIIITNLFTYRSMTWRMLLLEKRSLFYRFLLTFSNKAMWNTDLDSPYRILQRTSKTNCTD